MDKFSHNLKFKLVKYPTVSRFKEKDVYDQSLAALTIFPYNNKHLFPVFCKLIINFSLKDLAFNKKKAIPFFLALELLTNQKCVATLSSKNILAWKLRKDSLVGGSVTLRRLNLYNFLDSLQLVLPRMEKFKPINFSKLNNLTKLDTFSLSLTELVLFYPIELGLGLNTDVKKIEINFIAKGLSFEEKVFLSQFAQIASL